MMKNSLGDKGQEAVRSVVPVVTRNFRAKVSMQRGVRCKRYKTESLLSSGDRSFFFSAHNFTDQSWPGAWDYSC